MLNTNRRPLLAAAALLALAAPLSAADRPPADAACTIEIPSLTAKELDHRVQVLAGLVGVSPALEKAAAPSGGVLQNDDQAFVAHDAAAARTAVFNKSANARSTLTDTIVSEKEARALFERTVEALAREGLLEDRKFDVKNAVASHTYGGIAMNPQRLVPRVLAYNFEAYRAVNGIPFLHNRISVTIRADGLLSEIEIGGPELRATPVAKRRRVTPDAVRSRFLAAHPAARVQAESLSYAISEHELAPGRVVEPRLVIAWNEELGDPKNPLRKVITRQRELAYALDDPAAAPTELQ
ncbi:MAG TPA: hypothetical protein VF310_05570 [Vicinamibacteria bacterium]